MKAPWEQERYSFSGPGVPFGAPTRLAKRLARDATRLMGLKVDAHGAQATLEAIYGNGSEIAENGTTEALMALTDECPDCLGSMSLGDSDYGDQSCKTCVWGRVVKKQDDGLERELAAAREALPLIREALAYGHALADPDHDTRPFEEQIAVIDRLLRPERSSDVPRMALRPHHEFPDELDDIVVQDVQMFRAEALDDNTWWMACYFAGGEQLTLSVHREKKPARIAVTVTEEPARWVDIDAEGEGR